MPGDGRRPEGWSSQEKFRVVLESAALSEAELAEYCRGKGLYVEQVREWRRTRSLCVNLHWTASVRDDIDLRARLRPGRCPSPHTQR